MSEVASLFVSVKANTASFQKGMATVDAQMGKTAKNAESSTKRIGGAWKALAGAFVIKSATDQVMGFDRAMRNVNSIAQLSEGRFQNLSKSVLSLSGKTAQAPQTLAEGMYDLVSSGFNANQSLLILKSTAKAASAGLTDTATSTKAVAAVLNAYKLKASDAAQVSDDLFQTVNLGVLSFSDLANNIGDVLPFAAQAGISLKEVGAAISTMTKQGLSAPEAITRLKQAIVANIKPSDDLKKVYKELGVTGFSDLLSKTGSFQAALETLSHKVGGTKEAMAQLFPDIRGLGGALTLTGRNAKGAASDLEHFQHTTGATDTVLKQQKKSLDYQWRQFKADLASVVDTYGTKLIPVFSTGLKLIKAAAPAIVAAGGAWVAYKTVALTQIALVKAAELGLFGSTVATQVAGRAGGAGSLAGKTFATKFGLAAAAGIGGFELGKYLYKHVGPVKTAGDFIGNTFGRAFYHSASQEINHLISGPLSRALRTITLLGVGQNPNQFNNPAVVPRSAFGKPKGSKGTGGLNTTPISLGGGSAPKAKGGKYSHQDLMKLWVRAGGDPAVADIAAAIAQAESGGVASVRNSIGATGLWQIYNGANTSMGLKDPWANAQAAVKKWKAAGGFSPWTTYTGADTGPGGTPGPKTYQQYLTGSGLSKNYLGAIGRGPGKKAPKIPNVIVPDVNYYDKMQKQLDHIQLLADAGLIPTDEGIRRERSLIKKFLKFLTGDDRLKAMRDLKNIPKTSPMAKNPTFPIDKSLNNPWLQAMLNHIDLQVGAGQLSEAQGNAAKTKYLQALLPSTTGDNKLAVQAAINSLTPAPTIPGWDKGQADLALAGLTSATGDDLTALNGLLGIAQGQLNTAVASGDNAAIVQWANEVKNLNDSITALKESTDKEVEQSKRQHDLDQEQIGLLRRALAISQSETSALGKLAYQQLALIGGTRAGLGRLTPTTSNAY